MKFDDATLSCPMCSLGLEAADLCDCDTDPMCVRDHRIYHVERPTWRWTPRPDIDQKIREGLANWGKDDVA